MISQMKKHKTISFEVYEHNYGGTIVYMKKGKNKLWLFNIYDGVIDFDVGTPSQENYKKIGIEAELNIEQERIRPIVYGHARDVIFPKALEAKELVTEIFRQLKDKLLSEEE